MSDREEDWGELQHEDFGDAADDNEAYTAAFRDGMRFALQRIEEGQTPDRIRETIAAP